MIEYGQSKIQYFVERRKEEKKRGSTMIKLYDAVCVYDKALRFSWKLKGACGQKRYQIRLYDEKHCCVWDSGVCESANRHDILCAAELEPESSYHWDVCCEGNDGSKDQAEGNSFVTGISCWSAKWVESGRMRKPLTDLAEPITTVIEQDNPREKLDPAVYMRKVIDLAEQPKKARLYVTAHGIYALWVNGTLVSDFLAPGNTSYGKRLEYQSLDVKEYLHPGENVIGVVLADGWYTGKIGAVGIGQQFGKENALLFQLNLTGNDGSRQVIGSDADMKWQEGAWEFADLIVGESYDANKELNGWMEAGYDDGNWKMVVLRDYGYEALELQSIEPVKILRTIVPKVYRSPNGELIVDAGENIAGYVSFALLLEAGQEVKLEYTETLDKEGNFLRNIVGQNKQQTDYYRCAKSGVCKWHPMFCFHGFQYVRITGCDDMNPEHYRINVIGTPMKTTGEFICSDSRLNQLQENILRSQIGNMICIPTDCPQRERTGWTGDMQIYAPTACYEMDVEQFLRHWLADMRNEQMEDGQIPHIVPYFPSHDVMKPDWVKIIIAAGWSDAAVIVPWRLYEAYGDIQILKENYEMMRKYMDFVEQVTKENPENEDYTEERKEWLSYVWNTSFQYGDWLAPSIVRNQLPPTITGYEAATLMYAYTTDLMAQICSALAENPAVSKENVGFGTNERTVAHFSERASHYRELNGKIRDAYAKEYMNPDGTMKKEFQGIYVLALAMHAVPEETKEAMVKHLVKMIHENGDCLDTGFLSIPFLLETLYENGERELANTLLFQEAAPSWLYEVKMGATTIWETWEAVDPDGNPKDFSMNHFAFGCVGEYLFRHILGIQRVEPGWKKVRIAPDVNCGLDYAKGSYDSIWGRISVEWKKTEKGVDLKVDLPPDVELVENEE